MKIYFAPLQGFTEDAYRRIHNSIVGGVDAYYTPFIRVENGKIRPKDLRDIRAEFNDGVNVIPQVIASSAQEMRLTLSAIAENGYRRADINMGCPFPLQTRHGRGAGLLPYPQKIAEIMAVAEEYDNIEFSVKMRLGLDGKDEWKEVLPLLNKAHLSHITLHPRIASQQYKGEVDLQSFADFATLCEHPLVYNGDICTTDDINRINQSFPNLKGIMIGRGLLARPTLALEYRNGEEMTPSARIATIKKMHSALLAHYERIIPGEAQCLNKIRTFWEYMEPELGKKAHKKIMKAGNMKNYLAAIQNI